MIPIVRRMAVEAFGRFSLAACALASQRSAISFGFGIRRYGLGMILSQLPRTRGSLETRSSLGVSTGELDADGASPRAFEKRVEMRSPSR